MIDFIKHRSDLTMDDYYKKVEMMHHYRRIEGAERQRNVSTLKAKIKQEKLKDLVSLKRVKSLRLRTREFSRIGKFISIISNSFIL